MLLHGPIDVKGTTYANLLSYFFSFTKQVQVGRACVVRATDLVDLLKAPCISVRHHLLNHHRGFLVDLVHFVLTDYVKKRTAEKYERKVEV